MGVFRKRLDPISDRSRALSAEIAALEAQIRELNAKASQPADVARPKVRSTAVPHQGASQSAVRDAIFEPAPPSRHDPELESEAGPAHFNELGVRKYDLAAVWRRLQNHFRGPTANNPRLVSYLAAGSIKGLRPLRYEKRVARNRFIALFVFLLLIFWGVLAAFYRSQS